VKVWLLAIAIALVACGPSKTKKESTGKPGPAGVQMGKASWYGGSFHGGPTASGETYNKHSMTAAHLKLKFNTRVRVTNLKNGRSVVVRINNRGPYSKGRIIDLSEAAARQLDMIEAGVVPVRLEVLGRP
jgi:rare lipoprotein A